MQNVRTDLAVEAHELNKKNDAEKIDGVDVTVEEHGDIKLTRVEILNENGAEVLGKAKGTYVTIEAPNIRYSMEDYENVVDIIASELTNMAHIDSEMLTLVAGLGNRDITPDALGCEVISNLLVTNHLKEHIQNMFDQNISGVCAIAPGVLGTTGIETAKVIKGISDIVRPQLVIAVDALAAADIRRVSTTIQIADTGIQPGAGVGNNRKGLNEETLGIKVIAIGVPTVIDAATISKVEIPEELAPLMVTTKDIDLIIERMAKTVANGINKALQPKMSLSEIESYIM